MINLIINEKKYVKNLIDNMISESNPYYALSLLARYYYHEKGYRKKKIMFLLNDFLYSHYIVEDFEKREWNERIEKIANNSRKYKLIDSNGIKVTVNEMKIIEAITGFALRRLAFTILCLAKYGNIKNPNNNGWVNYNSKDVFQLANISCSSYEREVKIGILYRKGLLEFPKQNDNLSYRVTYIDDSSNEALFVDDLRALGFQYMNYHEGGYVRCCECGIYMREKNDSHSPGRKRIYCDHCAAYLPVKTKTLNCCDCGNPFLVNSKNNKTKRCPYCSSKYRKEYLRVYMRNHRHTNYM